MTGKEGNHGIWTCSHRHKPGEEHDTTEDNNDYDGDKLLHLKPAGLKVILDLERLKIAEKSES